MVNTAWWRVGGEHRMVHGGWEVNIAWWGVGDDHSMVEGGR